MNVPRLRMIAGPNGSGKSTLLGYFEKLRQFQLGYSLNPDSVSAELERQGKLRFLSWGVRVKDGEYREFVERHPLFSRSAMPEFVVSRNLLKILRPARMGYFSAILCDFLRRRWLAGRESFTFETVMSSADKVDLLGEARKAGYRTYLYFICTDDPRINKGRIASRVRDGGHAVPAEKIVSRFRRSLALLPAAIAGSNRAYLFDNSEEGGYRLVAEFEDGRLMKVTGEAPRWLVKSVLRGLRHGRGGG